MNILMAASEAVPFAKTGGLADVAGALPRAIADLGHRICLFMPHYASVRAAGVPIYPTALTLEVPIGGRTVAGRVLRTTLPQSDVPVYLIDQPDYFDRPELYQVSTIEDGQAVQRDYPDNCERFVFFCRAVLDAARGLGEPYDVIHCNDWQTALIPVYLKHLYRTDAHLGETGSLLTIHNLAYQGQFWHWDMDLTGLDWALFHWQALEFHGHLNLLKGGIVFADVLNTVSPRYAREIQTDEGGEGLQGVLRRRANRLFGVINGVDYGVWNPATDRYLAANYSPATVAVGKPRCKHDLQRRQGLPVKDVPLIGQIGRLDTQKGWDLVAAIADDLLGQDVQLVVLGSGQPEYAALLERLHTAYPDRMAINLTFSDEWAHRIEAGADILLMPSRYEPGGLNQLYALKYGTVPVVRKVGGLADTIVDLTPQTLRTGTATGFGFEDYRPEALRQCLDRALQTWREPATWARLVHTGMEQDWSWSRSAREYLRLYEIARRREIG